MENETDETQCEKPQPWSMHGGGATEEELICLQQQPGGVLGLKHTGYDIKYE